VPAAYQKHVQDLERDRRHGEEVDLRRQGRTFWGIRAKANAIPG
jgi:hypothetical protein